MSLFSDPFLRLSFSFRPFSLLVMKVDSLTSLGLRSLREISEGSVYISNNTNLCYQHTVKWHQIFTGSQIKRRRAWNDIKFNKSPSQCGKTNVLKCSSFCLYCTHSNFTDSCDAMYSTRLSACVHVCLQRLRVMCVIHCVRTQVVGALDLISVFPVGITVATISVWPSVTSSLGQCVCLD